MDTVKEYREVIERVIEEYYRIPYSYGELSRKFIIDKDENNFLLLTIGWQNDKRVHGCLIHVEIIGDKVWIHRDGTEDGITDELVASGIPKKQIVLGFHHPDVRPYTEFAVN
ncbi:XisI protein [Pannus brasiliensis CCIBt3594]|uniref:XisI protein n=1 Tax=Pannus brasiliensis CCIBt3594 TaxID=1427578 RepID=A0AAW9QG77_9CHRO